MNRLLLLTITLLSVTCLAHANLLTNGDFESGNTGFTTGYGFESGLGPEGVLDGAQVYSVTDTVVGLHTMGVLAADHTSGTGNFMAVNGAIVPNQTVWSQTVPVRRPGRPDEMAGIVAFLCSDWAGYITGRMIVVDGGFGRSAW